MKTNFNNESEAFQYMYDTVDDSRQARVAVAPMIQRYLSMVVGQ